MSTRRAHYANTKKAAQNLATRAKHWKNTMTQRWMNYVVAVMVDRNGDGSQYPVYSYTLHLVMSNFSEFLIRIMLSFVFVLALAGVNAGVINFTMAAIAKGFVLGAGIMILGNVSSYSRFENVFASWWPSSPAMFGKYSLQPYADLVHVITYAISQYLGSIVGLALAMWVSNAATVGLGNPAVVASTFGLLGTHVVNVNDIWLLEIIGSAILTFAWLMLVVHRQSAEDNVHVGLSIGFIFAAICAVILPATGANFDFIHYAALRTIMANKGADVSRHGFAYIFAPLIGAAVAWVGYIIMASLGFAGNYERPGMIDNAETKRIIGKYDQSHINPLDRRMIGPKTQRNNNGKTGARM